MTSLQYKFVQIFALSNSCKNKFLSISTKTERKVIQAILNTYGIFLGQGVSTKCKFYKIVDEANLGRSVNEYEMKKNSPRSHCTMCTLFSIFFCATEQAQTYLRTCICPSLFEYAENTFVHIFVIFKL